MTEPTTSVSSPETTFLSADQEELLDPHHSRSKVKNALDSRINEVSSLCLQVEGQAPLGVCYEPLTMPEAATQDASWRKQKPEEQKSRQSLTEKVAAMNLSVVSFGPPLAGAAAGVGVSGLIGLAQKGAATQAKEAALGAAQDARAAAWDARWSQIQFEEMCEGIGELAAKNPNPTAYHSLGREWIQGIEKVQTLERAVPPAEAAAKAAVERAAATEILPLGRTAILGGVGAVLGGIALAFTPSELGKE